MHPNPEKDIEKTTQAPAVPAVKQSAPPAPAAAGKTAYPARRRPYGHPKRKVCRLCAEQIRYIDYKQFQIVRTFTTESGKMLSSRITGTCAKHQRQVARAVKRNRNMAILPHIVF